MLNTDPQYPVHLIPSQNGKSPYIMIIRRAAYDEYSRPRQNENHNVPCTADDYSEQVAGDVISDLMSFNFQTNPDHPDWMTFLVSKTASSVRMRYSDVRAGVCPCRLKCSGQRTKSMHFTELIRSEHRNRQGKRLSLISSGQKQWKQAEMFSNWQNGSKVHVNHA